MDATRFERISNAFAMASGNPRLSRRRALTRGANGLVAGALAATGLTAAAPEVAVARARPGAGQEATPEPGFDPAQKTEFLFVQTFQGGSVAPVEGEEGRFTLTLDGGTGQTVFFADRPDRTVGATPTAQFLEGLGITPGNPPNAALVVETAAGETDVAVVELFNPRYDPIDRGVTYEVEVLADWEDSLELGFREAPTDLAALAPSFGAAHLFIDDCADANVSCCRQSDISCQEFGCTCTNVAHDFGTMGYCYNYAHCVPCVPYYHTNPYNGAAWDYWNQQCNEIPACGGDCVANYWV